MNTKSVVFLASIAVLAVAVATPAAAEGIACVTGITGVGKAANPLNYDPPRHYDMLALAKRRAIANWHEEVEAKCPHASSYWFRARTKKVTCDGYAGGTGCEAFAIPARRS